MYIYNYQKKIDKDASCFFFTFDFQALVLLYYEQFL